MSNPFLAEIRILPFNFPPKGWAFCDGQLMPISQNTALFSLLGTNYGGNGQTTFALPNLQGSVPLHAGGAQPGPGLTPRVLGETGGEQSVTLLETEMPAHSHGAHGSTGSNQASPSDNAWASGQKLGGGNIYAPSGSNVPMSPSALSIAGGGQPHNNLMPYLCLNFCIALLGVFPPRA
jgi:microcystin-dependent protein